ncbi:hypothetical protein [Arthrobacter sp. 18067]|uniref:hypothetical protein n=1 Tax=Arthrobacter sp. 18067 TaxID=2681413 RepID=UPI001358076D|nr:hypothetical protein [Arthrobacter sp. 18067]
MSRLFYYQADDVWAVSTSLAALADHLRDNNVRIRPNYAQLTGLGSRGRLTDQMASFHTVFEGIRVAPSGHVIVLRGDRLEVRQIERGKRPATYAEGLSNFLELWVSRIAGILADRRAHLECDLSGGIDSRTVFAIVRAAASAVEGAADRIDLRSNEKQTEDFVSASGIAKEYGLELNKPGARIGARLRKGRAPVSWRDGCMGNYLLTYFNKVGSHPFAMHCHGAGGEIYRNAYAGSLPTRVADKQEQDFPAHFYGAWRGDFLESVDYLKSWLPEMDPMQAHYREFRNRFHFGHRPHSSVVLSMLNSAELEFVADYPEVVTSRQLYFDVMESLVPGLAHMPYDKDSKAPTSKNLENLTVLDVMDNIEPGTVYAQEDWESGLAEQSSEYGFTEFLADGAAAVNDPAVQSFVGPEMISNARAALEYGALHGRFSHPNGIETKDLNYCLTVAWVLRTPIAPEPAVDLAPRAHHDGTFGASDDIEDATVNGRLICAICGKGTLSEPCQEHQPQAWAAHIAGNSPSTVS